MRQFERISQGSRFKQHQVVKYITKQLLGKLRAEKISTKSERIDKVL